MELARAVGRALLRRVRSDAPDRTRPGALEPRDGPGHTGLVAPDRCVQRPDRIRDRPAPLPGWRDRARGTAAAGAVHADLWPLRGPTGRQPRSRHAHDALDDRLRGPARSIR